MFYELRKKLQDRIDDGISRDDAIKHVINLVLKNKSETEAVVEEAINIAASDTVSRAISDHRRAICLRAESISKARETGSENLKKKVAGLMKLRLPSGLVLSEATGPECMEAYTFYMKSASVQYHRGQFLRDVANIAGDACVKDVLDEDRLQKLYEDARRISWTR
jgi:hypothetical protein